MGQKPTYNLVVEPLLARRLSSEKAERRLLPRLEASRLTEMRIPVSSEGIEVKSMSLEENKAIVSRFVEEVQNNHNLDAVNELFDRNMVDHLGQPGLSAAEGFKRFYSGLLAAFPDLRCVVHSQVAEGDKVATHKTFHGTHKGEFMGMPPTGKEIAVDVIDIFRIAGGKMVEHWAVQDLAGLMRQLNVKPRIE